MYLDLVRFEPSPMFYAMSDSGDSNKAEKKREYNRNAQRLFRKWNQPQDFFFLNLEYSL
jgi:hypothetical protein